MKCSFLLMFSICVFTSCGNNDYPPADNPLDAGREFIDACLKGQFRRASFYMIQDSANDQQLKMLETNYDKKDGDTRQQYREASIVIDLGGDETLNDSTHIIHYRNSYDKIGRKVKVIQRNGIWFVDLKYTFDGNL
jgi:hypothetical protein